MITRAAVRAAPLAAAIAIALCAVPAPAHGQAAATDTAASPAAAPADPHAAQPERPTVATHAYTVAPGYVEVEAGTQYQRPVGGAVTGFPVVVKIGAAPRVQVDVAEQWTEQHTGHASGLTGGPGDLVFAAKVRVADKLPVLADFSVQPALKLPTGPVDRGFGTGTTDGSLLLISSRQIGPVEIDINTGITLRSGDGSVAPKTSTLWTVSGGAPVYGPLAWTTEVFGYPGTHGPAGARPQVGLLFGPTYTAKKWLVFDTGAIVNLEGIGSDALYAGVTANLGRWF